MLDESCIFVLIELIFFLNIEWWYIIKERSFVFNDEFKIMSVYLDGSFLFRRENMLNEKHLAYIR